MKTVWILLAVALIVGLVVLGLRLGDPSARVDSTMPAPIPVKGEAPAPAEASGGFLYGRVTTLAGATYEGRLRFGGDQEAFWSDLFDGFEDDNPWAVHVAPELRPTESRPLEIFGFEIARRERPLDLGRRFLARFGDLARIEASGADVRVTLKSGTVVVLDRFEAGDIDDGLRIWDAGRGVVDLDSAEIAAIDLLPTPALGELPGRMHGTVLTRRGELTGFVQWDREECVGTDELDGESGGDDLALRFDTLRSIARHGASSSRVTLRDGRELVLSGTSEAGDGHRGVFVDDPRYGRVLVTWEAFERVDFDDAGAAGSGPGYDDFPPGRTLTGSVTTRSGRRLAGRLVYDLDESESTETLDAPSGGIDYLVPFDRITAIALPGRDEPDAGRARVTLHDGETLELELAGDLGTNNAGLLIFVDSRERPEYVPWADVARIDLDRPPA